MITQPNESRTFWGMGLYAAMCLISMATMSIGAALVIAAVLFERGGPRRFAEELHESWELSPWFRRYVGASLLLALAWTASLAFADAFPLRYGDAVVPVNWPGDLAKLWYFFLPPVLMIGWRRQSEPRRAVLLRTWFISFGVLSAIGIPQLFTGWPKAQPNPLLPGYFHTILLLGHHLSVASIWIFPFFALLDLSADREKASGLGIPRILLFAFLLLGFFDLIFTYSRTLWFALPLGLSVWLACRLPGRRSLPLLCALGLGLFGISRLPLFEGRLHTPMGVDERLMLWKANLEFFQSRPVFGVGFGKNLPLSENYQRWLHPGLSDYFVGHAHSIYLEILAGMGLFGLVSWLLWLTWLFGALAASRRSPRQGNFVLGSLCAWVVFLLNGLTQVNFWEAKVLHQVMWSAGIILFWAGSAQNSPQNSNEGSPSLARN